MSRKQLIWAAALLAVVLGLWGMLARTRHPVNDRVGLSLTVLDTTAIDSILLMNSRDTARFVRVKGNRWTVNGKPVQILSVHLLLKSFADTTIWTELIAENKASLQGFGLSGDSLQRIRVTSGKRVLVDVITGRRTPDQAGIYLKRPDNDAAYALHGNLALVFSMPPADWRDKTIDTTGTDTSAEAAAKNMMKARARP